jgi:hypothetical protein
MATNGVNGVDGARAKHDISALKVNQSRLLDAIHVNSPLNLYWANKHFSSSHFNLLYVFGD